MRKIIFIPLAFILLLLAIGSVHVWWPSTSKLIELTKIGLSWPVLITTFLCTFIFLFEEPIRNFLNEVIDVQTGKLKLSRQQEQMKSSESISIEAVNSLMLQRDFEWQKTLEGERQIAAAVFEHNREMQDRVQKMYLENIYWRFSYANLFLVPKTKWVLVWFSISGKVNVDSYNEFCQPLIQNRDEPAIMLTALKSLGFVEEKENEIYTTPLGDLFVKTIQSMKGKEKS